MLRTRQSCPETSENGNSATATPNLAVTSKGLFISGEWVGAHSRETITSVNPASVLWRGGQDQPVQRPLSLLRRNIGACAGRVPGHRQRSAANADQFTYPTAQIADAAAERTNDMSGAKIHPILKLSNMRALRFCNPRRIPTPSIAPIRAWLVLTGTPMTAKM